MDVKKKEKENTFFKANHLKVEMLSPLGHDIASNESLTELPNIRS